MCDLKNGESNKSENTCELVEFLITGDNGVDYIHESQQIEYNRT